MIRSRLKFSNVKTRKEKFTFFHKVKAFWTEKKWVLKERKLSFQFCISVVLYRYIQACSFMYRSSLCSHLVPCHLCVSLCLRLNAYAWVDAVCVCVCSSYNTVCLHFTWAHEETQRTPTLFVCLCTLAERFFTPLLQSVTVFCWAGIMDWKNI